MFGLSEAKWYAGTLFFGGAYALTLVFRAPSERIFILFALGVFNLTAGFLLWKGNPIGKFMGVVVMILIAVWGLVTWNIYDNRFLGIFLVAIGWLSAWLFFRIDLKQHRG